MAPFVSTIEIDVPPQEVFAYWTDPTRFHEWQRDVVGVQVQDGSTGAPGDRFTTTRWIGPTRRTMTQEITASEAPRRWSARAVDGAVRPQVEVVVEPVDGGRRSRVHVALDFEASGPAAALLPLVRGQAAAQAPLSYRNLKDILESGRAVP